MLIRALVAMAPSPFRTELRRSLRELGIAVSSARTRRQFWQRVGRESFDVILVSLDIIETPAGMSPLLTHPDPPDLIAVGPFAETEREAFMAGGAVAVLDTTSPPGLSGWLTPIIERRRASAKARIHAAQSDEEFHLGDFTSQSAAMRILIKLAKKVASSDTSLLIQGETGVGKGWLARAIHEEGPRAGGPFVSVNLAAVPESLIEGELFGYQQGAFTGAVRSHRGYFEMAHGGTLFLDEVAELSPHLQAKLLNVLQDRMIQRVGSENPFHVDVRVMAATNRDLEQEIQAKRFRDDLFYRLSVVSLTVPSLRDRPEDVVNLLGEYFEHYQKILNCKVIRVQDEVYRILRAYDWPGNVRELMNIVERSVLLCEGGVVTPRELPVALRPGALPPLPILSDTSPRPESLTEAVARAARAEEFAYLDRVLRATQGRVGAAASLANISQRTLFTKMKKHGLHKETYKQLFQSEPSEAFSAEDDLEERVRAGFHA